MKGELKRAMKLMWGCGEKIRWSCGCSLTFCGFFLVMALIQDGLFFSGRNLRGIPGEEMPIYKLGVLSIMTFCAIVPYGNSSTVLSSMGKWLCSSKLAKTVAVKATILNRLILFGAFFLPGLFTRIRLICLGYGEYAKTALFLVVAGLVYMLSAIGSASETISVILWGIFLVSIFLDKFWNFAAFIKIPVFGAVAIFVACMVIGTILEKYGLEYTFRKRKVGRKFIMSAKIGIE